MVDQQAVSESDDVLQDDVGYCNWPKGPYTQQIEGVLPTFLTEELIMAHLQSSGKRLKKNKDYNDVDYSTLQRGYQYFMESYIPGKYVRFCCKDDLVWVQAHCYRSQKKNDPMHQLKLAISCNAPYHVVKAYCSCVAGCSGMCSHVVGLLKQLIHYVMMKLKSVSADLTCTQMHQSWHKPRPTEIESVPVMNVAFCKAKQCEAKKDPIICILYKARAKCMQVYSFEQQQCLKEGFLEDHPTCAFAKMLSHDPLEEYVDTPFGSVPKSSVLSYQAFEYEKPQINREDLSQQLPALPLSIIENAPCVFNIESEEQHAHLSTMNISLDEAHSLEQSTRQQSLSTKWQESRIGKVTASHFGDVLLRKSLPSELFVKSFFESKQYSSVPAQINHGFQNEAKARSAYCTKTGFVVHTCGLVVNPSLPWLGASPDGLVEDPSEKCVGLLEIKCPFTYRFSTVEEACIDPKFFETIANGQVTLKQDHKHYYQVQGQMALSRVSWCDLVIYTHQNFTIQRIEFNEDFWNDIQSKLTEFFFKYILPKQCKK